MSWNWPEIDKKKVERAKSVKILTLDKENCALECIGSGGEIYQVSLSSCTCTDFARKHDACKHMIRLAMELGILNESGNTMEQQREVDLFIAKHDLAYWFGCYYLFNSPVVSDDEYDALKRKLKDEYGVSFPDFTEYSNVQNDSFASVRIFLDSQNYEYIDKTAQGGCLYIFDEKAVDVIKAMGLAVSYAAEGTRSTKHRPAWYVKSDK